MDQDKRDQIDYLVLMVTTFARQHKLSEHDAFRYMLQYGGFAFCRDNWKILQSYALEENMEYLETACQKNGGKI